MDGKAVREALGTLAVVASLVFVGLQVRQSTAVAREEAYHAFMSEIRAENTVVATDDRLAGLLAQVYLDGATQESFSAEDQVRLREYFLSLARVWEGLYRATSVGILGETELSVVGRGDAFRSPFVQDLWPSIRPQFSDEFLAFFEPQVGLR